MYTRQNPSPEYHALQEQYRILHEQGGEKTKGKATGAKEAFANGEFVREAQALRDLMRKHQVRSLINFGAGQPSGYYNKRFKLKGTETIVESMYDYLGKPYTKLYDPGVEEISQYPDHPSELVICSDVLEHIPEPDIDWFLDELAELATKVIHVTIHLGPAIALLPDGRNAHVTIRPAEWWKAKIAAAQTRCKHKLTWNAVYRYPIDNDGKLTKIDYSKYM